MAGAAGRACGEGDVWGPRPWCLSAADPSPPHAAASRRVSHSRRGDVFSVGICGRYFAPRACLPPERLL